MQIRQLSLRKNVNLAKLVIPALLIGVYVLWKYDKSHREANVASEGLAYSISSNQKPYKHFQQLQSAARGRADELGLVEVGRKVAAGARATFSAKEAQASNIQQADTQAEGAGSGVAATGGDTTGRLAAVKEAMQHSWDGYTKYAWGYDELLPGSQKGEDGLCSTGATILDSLDTLWIMGMKDEFERARDWVEDGLSFNRSCATSLFEITIRDIGGLLAAHDLSGDPLFLDKAREFADRMMSAFDTTTGIPKGTVNLGANVTLDGGGHSASLAELGTIQLEFMHLSQLSGEERYGKTAAAVIQVLHDKFPDQGLLPTSISYDTGVGMSFVYTLGAMGDSYYEYLLKVWILTGRRQDMYRSMWVRAMDEMIKKLVHTSQDGYTYVAILSGFQLDRRMEHLTCFVAGNLALGVHAGAVDGARAEAYLSLAKNLTDTCYSMYHTMPTGLSPEFVGFASGSMQKGGAPYNILRPEAVESMFMLWRVTGDPVYREYGWSVFNAFQNYSRVASGGYSGINDVGAVPPVQNNKMETFWLAETLKYLYLLFSPDSSIPLGEYVFNTEAHPLRIPAATVAAPAGAPKLADSIS